MLIKNISYYNLYLDLLNVLFTFWDFDKVIAGNLTLVQRLNNCFKKY